jgi:mono/diheme cytochrome c family protein
MAEHLATGKRIYYQNCLPCHGDRLDGGGHFAHGFSPTPASFADNGTIAQLTESYVFWRVAKGGPGLPREGTPWNSAMPVWENFLTEDEIWAVVLYIYDQSGWKPRRWEATAEESRNPPGQRQPNAPPNAPPKPGGAR